LDGRTRIGSLRLENLELRHGPSLGEDPWKDHHQRLKCEI
jgi:hypothetical protein